MSRTADAEQTFVRASIPLPSLEVEPAPSEGVESREALPVQGTVAGRAFASTSIVELEREGGGRRVWLPLLDGTERLGVAEMTFAEHDEPLPESLLALCERYAHLIAT